MKASTLSQASIYQDECYEIIDMSQIMPKKGDVVANSLTMLLTACRRAYALTCATSAARATGHAEGLLQAAVFKGRCLIHNANSTQ